MAIRSKDKTSYRSLGYISLSLPKSERGQAAIAFVLLMMAIMALTVTASKYYLTLRKEDRVTRQYSELALQAAHAGFIDAFAWFRRNQGATSHLMSGHDDNQPGYYPDGAFLPQRADSDFFDLPAADPVGNSALVRSESLSPTADSNPDPYNQTWIRYVVKRQFEQNFPVSVPAYQNKHDLDAAHDVSHLRGDTLPGSGTTWTITSRGYAYRYPHMLTETAAHEGSKLYNAPLKEYQNKELRMGAATVFGEIVKLNFFDHEVAIWVDNGNNVNMGVRCTVNGNGYSGIGRNSTNNATGPGTLVNGYKNGLPTPSYSSVFGFSLDDLKGIADEVGDINILPAYNAANPDLYKDAISRQKFLIIEGNTVFQTPPAAPDPNHRLLNGTGLLIVDGNLTIQSGTGGNWNGILFVDGNVVINKPFEIRGTLVCTGTVTLNGNPDVVDVFYSKEAIDAVKNTLINFRINRKSVQARITE